MREEKCFGHVSKLPVVHHVLHRTLALAIERVKELWVHGDPVRLSQIVANLLLNAAKFTAPGGAISISAERQGERVAIRLADNGIGIAAGSIETIFGLFEQSGHAPDRVQDGLGIGLSLVRKLVRDMNGNVSHDRDPRAGLTHFRLHLPQAPDAA